MALPLEEEEVNPVSICISQLFKCWDGNADQVNPVRHRLHLSTSDYVRTLLLGVTLLPFRLCGLLSCFVLAWAVASVGMVGADLSHPLVGWQAFARHLVALLGRLSMFFCGFHHVQVKETRLCQNGWIFRKFQNGLWPTPPAPFSEKKYCDFFRKPVAPALNLQWFSDQKWPPPFWSFFQKFMTKIAFSKAKKMQWNFLDRKWPPPPFRKFSGNSSVLVDTGFP